VPLFCEDGDPEAMMQACLQIMAPGDRSSSSAEHEMMAGAPKRVGQGESALIGQIAQKQSLQVVQSS
jgi:hypothetical protein